MNRIKQSNPIVTSAMRKMSIAVILAFGMQSHTLLAASQHNTTDEISEQTLATLAKKARQTGDFTQALQHYETLIVRNPQLVDYKIAHALVQIDRQEYTLAEAEIATLKENYAGNVELLNAQLYLGQQTHSPIKILDASQRLLALNPKDTAMAGTLASAASDLGATSKANELQQQYQFEANQAQPIKASHAASYVRWGELEPQNPLRPYADTDQALNALDKACQCDWATVDVNDIAKRKLVFDRMLALRDRHRAAEVIAHFNQLNAQHIELPVYAMSAVADAYLELREPEHALTVLDAILVKDPQNYNTKLDKFYALIELERFDEATAHIQKIAAEEPSYLNRNDNPTVRQNDKKLQADTVAAMGMAYGDNLAGSEQALVALQNIGPSNPELKNNLANIWRWRGWVDLAGKTYQDNLAQDKYDTQARYGLAHTYLDGRDWVLADKEIQTLNTYITPDDPALKELNKRWDLHQKRQFISDFNTGKSSGAAIGTKSSYINAWLYSAPFNDNYRVYANTDYNHGTFPEGSGAVLAPAVGLEYRSHDWLISSQLGLATQDGHGATGAVRAEYRADDYWLFNSEIAFNSQQAPVRGQRVGIQGDLMTAGLTYRWSELTQAAASVGYMHMSDGNTRENLQVAWDRRMYTQPHYKANVRIDASASRNSRDNTVYFNPKSDVAIGATLRQDWLTWRRYDRSFTQRLALGIGNYQQQDFGSGATWAISYSHDWDINRWLNLEYGIGRRSQPYDGIRESRSSLFGHINLLF